ncbi:MAG: peptidoglycan DD-metalloendopeptidase family protein [Anaerolineaceae bacterium]|nr:peptidoglycan DD-metalloendopeptidase family protein [Anaerolineaceae bacterium]
MILKMATSYRLKFFSFILLFAALSLAFLNTRKVSAQESPPLPVYIVQPGETLSVIAVRFGIPIEEIIRVNELADPNAIAAGSQIRIPGLEGVEGTLVPETVSFGNNLTSLIISHHFPMSLMVKLNRITSPGEIYAGSTLIVPQQDPDKVLAPQVSPRDTQSLLDVAAQNKVNPWIYELSNNLEGSWNLAHSQILFGPKIAGQEFSPISPLINGIEISPLPLVQGKTTELFIKTQAPLQVTGTLGEQELSFSPLKSGGYFAFAGIYALATPGLYPISIEGKTTEGQDFKYSQQILLVPGNYPQEYVVGVDAATIEDNAIQSENKILAEIRGSETSQLWDVPFSYPVDEPCLASRFGNRRSYNLGEYYYYHSGLDFIVCANNLNIYAAAPGIVKFTGELPIRGNFTLIDHGLGVYSGYAHQSEILVHSGDRVEAGQQIGVIGNTGRSVGPHLHWEIWINHIPVDPFDWLDRGYPDDNTK